MKLTLNVRNWFLYLEMGPEPEPEIDDEETSVAAVSEMRSELERSDEPSRPGAMGFRRMP